MQLLLVPIVIIPIATIGGLKRERDHVPQLSVRVHLSDTSIFTDPNLAEQEVVPAPRVISSSIAPSPHGNIGRVLRWFSIDGHIGEG